MKVIWLSDLHYISEGSISGFDPRVRLDAAVAHINAHASDCDFCVVSGDLVDVANARNYEGVKRALDQLSIPYFPMMGNHDAHSDLRDAFRLPEGAMDRFVQYAIPAGGGLIVCLDTKAGAGDGGILCADRLDWLSSVLQDARGRPVYVFLHHPPVHLNLPPFDAIGLKNAPELIELLVAEGCVRHIFAGHVHRSISGHVSGIPFTITQAVVYQSPPIRPAWDWESFTPDPVAPSYSVIHMQGDDVVVHSVPFCAQNFGKV